MKCPAKHLSGSAWRKIFEIINRCGRFAPSRIAKRNAARLRRQKGVSAYK